MNFKVRQLSRKTIHILLPVLLLSPLLLKAIRVDFFIHGFTGVWGLGATQVFFHDAPIYAAIITLLYLSFLPHINHWLAKSLRLVSFIIFLIYIVDFFIIISFSTHLSFQDASQYASYSFKYLSQFITGSGTAFNYKILIAGLSSIFALVLFGLVLGSRKTLAHSKTHLLFLSAIIGCIVASFFASGNQYIHSWIYQNVVEYNKHEFAESKPYSAPFKLSVVDSEQYNCAQKAPTVNTVSSTKPNIILLMVESLSSYQSNLFSGINNWTPHIDALAQEGRYFSNFYANGFNTEDGEISLLTGELPIYPPALTSNDGGASFKGFFAVASSLPQFLKASGYHTEFISTADLSFANTENWARSQGFDVVEGHSNPFYNTYKRYAFKAAPDEALYGNVLTKLTIANQHPAPQPYFFFLKTVSTHHPYTNPKTGKNSQEQAFRYADGALGTFYAALRKQNFFKTGILIIVGDHHAMVPLLPQEITRFGPYRAAARIPMIIVNDGLLRGEVTSAFQQTDVRNSIKNLVEQSHCTSAWHGDLLASKPVPPRYIAHRRGDSRDEISVFKGTTDILLNLNGDATGISSINPSTALTAQMKADIVNHINAGRIAKQP